jgi:hypothetical protein
VHTNEEWRSQVGDADDTVRNSRPRSNSGMPATRRIASVALASGPESNHAAHTWVVQSERGVRGAALILHGDGSHRCQARLRSDAVSRASRVRCAR